MLLFSVLIIIANFISIFFTKYYKNGNYQKWKRKKTELTKSGNGIYKNLKRKIGGSTCSVDAHFGSLGKAGIFPYSLAQFRHDHRRLCNSAVDVIIGRD